MAFVALAVGACGAPDEEAKPRPLPEETRELEPGAYRTEEFEPAFSFEVSEGWSSQPPETYDLLLLARSEGVVGLGFANLRGARFFKPTETGDAYMVDALEDVAGWFQRHPYLKIEETRRVAVGGKEGTRIDYVLADLPNGYESGCGSTMCVNLVRFSSGGRPLVLLEEDKARLVFLDDVEGETVVTGFSLPAAVFDDHAPEAQRVIDTVEWRGG